MTDRRLEAKLGFDKVREMVSARCMTDYAVQRVADEEFVSDRRKICSRLNLCDEMRLVLMFEENFPVSGYIDGLPFLEPLLKDGSNIDVLGIAKLKTLVDTARHISNFFLSVKRSVYPNLQRMVSPLQLFPEVQRRIETIIDKYGEIKDSASPELYEIRRALRDRQGTMSKRASAVLRRLQDEGVVDGDAAVSVRDGKFLIPVPTASKRKVQGFVYDESASGKTTFVEPAEIVELENELIELQFAQEREIARILHEFTEFLRPYVPEMCSNARIIGELDFLMAKTRVGLDFISGMPVVSDDGCMRLRKARHPLLEKALRRDGKQIVPLSVTLEPSKHILLISGPNAGGKSVCLKTVGLLQYMFQWGMLIPTSESSELPVFERIMVSIGDDQSLENDLSTYSSFLADMREMLSSADSRTLVLIDEFGSGTEPAAGGAIAEAILSELDRRGVYGVITTHYTNLKLYASASECGVINGAMQFDASRIEPLFQLEIGLPGNSFAFELARKMQLPEAIVKDAENRAGEEFVGIERNLRKIVRNRRALDIKLQKIKHTDRELEGITEQYRSELEEIQHQRGEILDEARRQAEDIVRGAGAKVERTIREIKEAQAEKERTKAARKELQGFLAAIGESKAREQSERDAYLGGKLEKLERRRGSKKENPDSPDAVAAKQKSAPLKVGEKVRITDSGMVGEVAKISSKSVTIIVGSIQSTMSPDKVERISSNDFREASRKLFRTPQNHLPGAATDRMLSFKPELDVRGQRLADAMREVTRFIDDAMMLGIGRVRIIHGKGTGVLHQEIQKYLKTIPGVSVSDEDVRAGGSGVTIASF